MREIQGEVDQLVSRLRNRNRGAEQSVKVLTKHSESWEDDRRFTDEEIRPILDAWHQVLDEQHERLSGNGLDPLVRAISRVNRFSSSVGIHPRVLRKRAEIHLITVFRWFKVTLILLLWLAILAGTLSLAVGVVIVAVRVSLYLIAMLGDVLQELLRYIMGLL